MKFQKSAYQFIVRALISLGEGINAGCVRRTQRELGLDQEPCKYSVTTDLVFTPTGWGSELQGDLYLPMMDDAESLPVVLLVHGGGWAENDNRYQMKKLAKSIVEQGFAVFSITYRLAPEHRFPAQVDDLLEALRWLNRAADTYQLDMQRTAIFGYSAGGHLGELAAIRMCELPEAISIRAVVAGGTPHFVRLDPDFPLVQDLMGHVWQDDPDRYLAATPVDCVTKDFPPVFIYHGEKDNLVPWPHVEKWEARLRELGVEHEIHWVKGKGHIGAFLIPRDAIMRAIHFMRHHILKE